MCWIILICKLNVGANRHFEVMSSALWDTAAKKAITVIEEKKLCWSNKTLSWDSLVILSEIFWVCVQEQKSEADFLGNVEIRCLEWKWTYSTHYRKFLLSQKEYIKQMLITSLNNNWLVRTDFETKAFSKWTVFFEISRRKAVTIQNELFGKFFRNHDIQMRWEKS